MHLTNKITRKDVICNKILHQLFDFFANDLLFETKYFFVIKYKQKYNFCNNESFFDAKIITSSNEIKFWCKIGAFL